MNEEPGVPTDADLLESVRCLVGPAIRNQLWLFPYDEDGVPMQLVVPIEGVPFTPDVVPRLAEAVLEICRSADAGSVGLLWERPGPQRLTPREAAAVDATVTAIRADLPVRASFLSWDDDVTALPLRAAA
ncbi:MAG TPA: hypothetical protein VIG76_14280 [Amnibacterium sp.]|jgi:hypothetical protein|uniref:hypothetical protein n=1 Tax=Amnibacterium sp. TaxID=1872496 RepID=UPI002F95BCFB